MAKEKAEYKPEEHITPEQYAELVKLFAETNQGMLKLAQTMRETRAIVYKIVGVNGRIVPPRYKKSPQQTAKEIVRANNKTKKAVEKVIAGTLPTELPSSLSSTPEKLFTGKDLGMPHV